MTGAPAPPVTREQVTYPAPPSVPEQVTFGDLVARRVPAGEPGPVVAASSERPVDLDVGAPEPEAASTAPDDETAAPEAPDLAVTGFLDGPQSVSDLLPPAFRRPMLLRETGAPDKEQGEIVRMTAIVQPTRVYSKEDRWFHRVRYD